MHELNTSFENSGNEDNSSSSLNAPLDSKKMKIKI